jgi:hypothetical protein
MIDLFDQKIQCIKNVHKHTHTHTHTHTQAFEAAKTEIDSAKIVAHKVKLDAKTTVTRTQQEDEKFSDVESLGESPPLSSEADFLRVELMQVV